jgi:hypothetical protein
LGDPKIGPRERKRASSLVSPKKSLSDVFLIQTVIFGPIASLISRFSPDLGLNPSGEPTPSPVPRGALGDSGRSESAQNAEKSLPRFRFVFTAEVDPAGQRQTHRLPRAENAAASQLAADA